MNVFEGLARVLRVAATECDILAAQERAERRDWIAQSQSPLGPRRHIRAARRRLSAGLDGVTQLGRKWLLSPAAIREELGRPEEPAEVDEVASMRAELALVRGGRR